MDELAYGSSFMYIDMLRSILVDYKLNDCVRFKLGGRLILSADLDVETAR